MSLKHAQFLSFSENRNSSRLLRTFSRCALKYNSLHCFLIECTKPAKEKGILVAEGQFVFQSLTSFEKGLSA